MKMLTSFEQGSPEWKQARAGKVTASRAKDARDKLKSGAASGKQIVYACQVALERVSGQPADATFENWQMREGHVQEPIARAAYERRTGNLVDEVGAAVGLQAYIGEDAAMVANMAGRLVYIVCHAAGVHGLGETPEARILAGTANALADIAETPAELERQRGAVIAGLQAIDRLMPNLHTFSLAAGSMELDNLLHSASGMGTADVRRALGMG